MSDRLAGRYPESEVPQLKVYQEKIGPLPGSGFRERASHSINFD